MYVEHSRNDGLLSDLTMSEVRLSRKPIELLVKLIQSFDDEDSVAE